MNKTKIPWCDYSWNPVTGCTPISSGCANCYARGMARRLAGRYGYPEAPSHFDVTLRPDRLQEPLHWRKPRRVFVCSMSDLFHREVPDYYIERVWQVMYRASQHTFLVLTKRTFRAQNLSHRFSNWLDEQVILPNAWMGVTVESQDEIGRLRDLAATQAAQKFASFEPLLSEIIVPEKLLREIDLVIVGCESGPNRRFTSRQWIRSLRDQCLALGDDRPAFFLKQMDVDGKVVSMPELDGCKWEEWPDEHR